MKIFSAIVARISIFGKKPKENTVRIAYRRPEPTADPRAWQRQGRFNPKRGRF